MSNEKSVQFYERYVKGPVVTMPGITRFVYTGEEINPWRCESCATKKQLAEADKCPTNTTGLPSTACCRKCGLFA